MAGDNAFCLHGHYFGQLTVALVNLIIRLRMQRSVQ